MSIQKKSLISTLKTAKKANVAAENKGEKQVSAVKIVGLKGVGTTHTKGMGHTSLKGLKEVSAKGAKSLKSLRVVW
jgi:hypothetical protein